METKANYVLIGLFALAGLFGILAFFLWFARVELDRQFAYYDIRFSSVAGLTSASDVRFSGLPVGQVVDVRLSPERDGTIKVRVEVDAETPIRTDSVATIEPQGVTGVSFVSIGAGTTSAPLLAPPPGQDIAEIRSARSTLQTLTEGAPQLVDETVRIVEEIGDLFRGENEGRLDRILVNAERASEEFAAALEGFSGVAGTVDQFSVQIARFNTTLDTLTSELAVVLATANETLQSIDLLADQATAIVASGTSTLDAVQGVVDEAQGYIAEDLAETTAQVQTTLTSLGAEITTLRTDASALLETLRSTGATATTRLQEAEVTLERVNTLLTTLETTGAAVEAAASSIDGLIEDQATPFLAETRAAVADATEAIQAINTAAQTDLPDVVADIRAAAENMRTVVGTVGEDLTTTSAGVSELVTEAQSTLAQVSDTFADANETLTAINAALVTGERTLTAAEGAFGGAEELIEGEITTLIAELEETVGNLNGAIGRVSEDLPIVSADVRAASAAASEAFAVLGQVVDASAPGVNDFTTTTLPLLSRLAQETRTLISNLDQLTQRIERNPTQFLLDRDLPEFRR